MIFYTSISCGIYWKDCRGLILTYTGKHGIFAHLFLFSFWKLEVVVVQIDAEDIVLNFQETFEISFPN